MARRKLGGYVKVPDLAGLPVLGDNVTGLDVLVGALAGALGGQLVVKALEKFDLIKHVPDMLKPYVPALSSAAAGVAAYYAQDKNARGAGHLVGAIAAAINQAAPEVQKKLGLAGYVSVPYGYQNYAGVITDDPRPPFAGTIVEDPRRLSDYNLGSIMAYSTSAEDMTEMEDMMN